MENEKNYEVKITSASKELSTKERVNIKLMAEAVSLDDETANGGVIIDIAYYAQLNVHNDNAEKDKDYTVYIFVDKNGTMYKSGSESLFRTFSTIYEEVSDDFTGNPETDICSIKVFRSPSKKHKEKHFLTCSMV